MDIVTRHYNLIDSNIPKELSGFQIALFSDVHTHYLGIDGEELTEAFDKINPDIVVFAGDACNKGRYNVDTTTGLENIEELFVALASRYEVYYVNGNHDKRVELLCNGGDILSDCYINSKIEKARLRYDPNGSSAFDDYISVIKSAGVHYLSNESIYLEDKNINIIGLDLPLKYYRHKPEELTKDELIRLIGVPRNDTYNLLIAHTPQFFETYAAWGADLTLSGHIHGGIIRIPFIGGLLSPDRTFFPKYDYGLFDISGKKLIVSSGVGFTNFRTKHNNPPEIVHITLNSKE